MMEVHPKMVYDGSAKGYYPLICYFKYFKGYALGIR